MTIKVYTISGAPRPWRVLLGLAFKGLDYETVLLNGSEREHKSEPFLSINRRGKVPVVVDGDVTMRDSIATLAWLDRAYPARPLFGETASEAAVIWQHTEEIAEYLRPAVTGVLAPVFFKEAREATPELVDAATVVKEELVHIERALDDSAFVAGKLPSAADAVAFPEVRLLQRANETKTGVMRAIGLIDLYDAFPRIGAWVTRIEQRPGYTRTHPPHWKAAA